VAQDKPSVQDNLEWLAELQRREAFQSANPSLDDETNKAALERLAKAINATGPTSSGAYNFACPKHEEGNTKHGMGLTDDGRLWLNCFVGCGPSDIWADICQNCPDPPAFGGMTVARFAAAKRLPVAFLESCGVTNTWYGQPAVAFAFHTMDGDVACQHIRLMLKAQKGEDRFRWEKGAQTCLYGLERLNDALVGGTMLLVEGESDCLTFWLLGLPAVGLPGAGNWNEKRDKPFLEGFSDLYVMREPGGAAGNLLRTLGRSQLCARIRVVSLLVKDPSELWVDVCKGDQAAFRVAWSAAVAAAQPLNEVLKTLPPPAEPKANSHTWTDVDELRARLDELQGANDAALPYQDQYLEALAWAKINDEPLFARVRKQLRDAKVRVTDIDDKIALWCTAHGLLKGEQMVVRNLADIEPKPVDWLWQWRFAVGKLSLIAGNPDLGKSLITLDIATRVTQGSVWPANEGQAPLCKVIILSAEDDAEDTYVPRLKAMGAVLSEIDTITMITKLDGKGYRGFSLQEDIERLEQLIELNRRASNRATLVIIDPVSAYMGKAGQIDTFRDTDVRATLAPLQAMAVRTHATVLMVTHFSKTGKTEALMRVIGSIAFTAAARAAFMVIEDQKDGAPPDRKLMLPLKNNLSPVRTGLAYKITPKAVDKLGELPVIEWEPVAVSITADQALAAKDKAQQQKNNPAINFLREVLSDGPREKSVVEELADDRHISPSQLRKARERLKIMVEKSGFPAKSHWRLLKDDEM
jgi:hypothetical protein